MTIGFYVHHVGRGHLHRATALAVQLVAAGGAAPTGLSSLERPASWPGEWIRLPRDDDGEPTRPTAGGRLHWAPLRHDGLRARAGAVSAWIERARPSAVVVDVSVEVALLARLHGVPVVEVVAPGHRGDTAHLLGLDVADALVGFWPEEARDMLHGVPIDVRHRLRCLGALSRFPVRDDAPRGGRHAVALLGAGGHDQFRPPRGSWTWTVIGGDHWVDDPSDVLRTADVVVTHAGQNAVAEVAALRRPAVVVPQDRPHDEQRTTAAVLRDGGWPAVVLDGWPADEDVLDKALVLDARRWADWCDGRAAQRFVDVVQDVVAR